MVKHVCNAYGSLFILFLSLFPVAVDAQTGKNNIRITINSNHIPLSGILKTIEIQTGYYFVFDNDILDVSAKVGIHFKHVPWKDVLAYILKDKNITWHQQDRRIFLQRKNISPVPPQKDSVTATISGIILTSAGTPLPGATIIIKGTSRGVTSGNEGQFSLEQANAALLHISSMGFISRDTVLAGTGLHKIRLLEAVNSLDAAVVIGYGASSRRLLTGSVSRIIAKQISQQPVANPLGALQGQIAGVLVTNTNGLPGAQVKLYIRGRNSIAAGNDPLFIIDGVPFDITPLNNLDELSGAIKQISPFNSINPSDIESIDILKDADATAIYGSRGANGVVLITTKKGRCGENKLDINIYSGAGQTSNHIPMLDTKQYLTMRREAFANDGRIPTVTEAPDLLVWDTMRNVNWQKQLTGGIAHITNAQISFSGGNSNTTFFAGGNFYKEGTVLSAPLAYRRGGGHLSILHHSKDQQFEASFSGSFTGDKNKSIANDVFPFYNQPPDYPLYDSAGGLFWGASQDNPEAYMRQQANSKTNNLLSNVVLRYRLLPGLNLKTSMGFADIMMQQVFTFPKSTQHPQSAIFSFTRFAENERKLYIVEPQADYTLRIARGSLHALVGGTWQQSNNRSAYAEGQGYANENMLGNLFDADTIIRRPDGHILYRYISFFTRLTYDWQGKYILNASYRRDGSSRFGPGRQFGDFGALGLAWIFTGESFMKEQSLLSFGKLRMSMGITGNDQIPDYQYMSNYGVNGIYQGNSTYMPLRIANNKYSWEENRKIEAAIELGFLKDRIFFSVAKYKNSSTNQLVGYQLASITGFTSYQANRSAIVENTGWEFELTTSNISQHRFSWSSGWNLSFFSNKLRAFDKLAASSYASSYVIGQPLNIVRGYHFAGVNSETGAAVFTDINKDGNLSSGDDYITISKRDPEYYGGINNDFSYNGFSLSFFWQFVKQQGQITVNTPGQMKNETSGALSRWRMPGDVTVVPRATATPGDPIYEMNENMRTSDAGYGDASYMRLRNLSLSYNLPGSWLKRLQLQLCRVYVQTQNLVTVTAYQGADPETQLALPPLKIITTGIQLTL
ncbi:TonB-linked outer membrane protein, SusC/RagA family [Chitinophaga sp. CF118]|uniref:SusC/RagA family TonB-linked outer membrane protein n=1 Tax=Chitinophaga sp. CF118 TaxID=1884367 RepID=UPI0008E7FF82|nr:SusC/RagA family TonB-linked outer membrane protein [Chitinophaga sp. CF118]SFD56210.1 TonB-linked outer membrane protein, SusC/RagA family [Chitinophaga sp. CF118]